MKIIEIVKMMLPQGTTSPEEIGWAICPIWPPDLFAVVATVIDRSGCYTEVTKINREATKQRAYRKLVRAAASKWIDPWEPPALVKSLWNKLIDKYAEIPIEDIHSETKVLVCLLKLFAISDEVCVGIGWSADENSGVFTKIAYRSLMRDITKSKIPRLRQMPHSLCVLVPQEIAVVLPKASTPPIGCTVRSMSSHLALLPGYAQIRSRWVLADGVDQVNEGSGPNDSLRLLIIPFPFHIPENSFKVSSNPQKVDGKSTSPGYFSLEQSWLRDADGVPITKEKFVAELIDPLFVAAKKGNGGQEIHGIIMPECALSNDLADQVAGELFKNYQKLEFFITGALETKDGGISRNLAKTFIFDGTGSKRGIIPSEQAKHHRWCLDTSQVDRYALNLSTDVPRWWEDIDVGRRELPFFVVRNSVALSVLICEDLARNDPAMPVIRAIGPNFVVALLMDGPQLVSRWPAKYATVLGDDPGSAVLSITCAGMVDRSNWLESRPVRSIGLWRDPKGRTQELNLPVGSTALLLSLNVKDEDQTTLDQRGDDSVTKKLSLASVMPLSLALNPGWL